MGRAVVASGPAAAPSASAAAIEADPDTDGDGIPDRCDACPREPGMAWDSFPVIDGCSTADFHRLAREPQGQVLNISYSVGSTAPPPREDLARVLEILTHPSVDSIAVVGRASPSEPRSAALARERARRMEEALRAGGVTAEMTRLAATGERPGVEIGVLSSDHGEVLRFVDDHFEHVDLAAWRERRKKAEAAPSPCGRLPGR